MAGVIGGNLAVEGEAGAILTRLGYLDSHGYEQMTRVLRRVSADRRCPLR